MIAINSYTTVKRRKLVPHEVFANYWRDVHGPLCSRLPGLGLYIQHHFNREQDAHLWPIAQGIQPISDYELDGGVEIGFTNAERQAVFKKASPLLFSDEQNMFEESLAYDLPHGSLTLLNLLNDEFHNGPDLFDRIHLHLSPKTDLRTLNIYLKENLGPLLASEDDVLKVRLHLCDTFINDGKRPPAPHVSHIATPDRVEISMLEVAFSSPLARRRFFNSSQFQRSLPEQAKHIAQLKAFAVSGVYTYCFNERITTAGLRGSRAAELIHYLGAVNQVTPEVEDVMLHGRIIDF